MIDFSEENVEHSQNRLRPIKQLIEGGPQALWLFAISHHTHKICFSLRRFATPAPTLPKCLGELGAILRREDFHQQTIPDLTELSLKKRWELLKRAIWSISESIRDCQEEMEEIETHKNVRLILSEHLDCLEEVYNHLVKQGRKEFDVT
jgi:hypothetical protein